MEGELLSPAWCEAWCEGRSTAVSWVEWELNVEAMML